MIRILTRYSPTPVVFVAGRIEGDDAAYLKTTLLELADHGYRNIALELSDARAVDNAGIGALLAGRGRLSQIGGTLCLVNASPDFLGDLRDTGMTDLFTCYGRLDDLPTAS